MVIALFNGLNRAIINAINGLVDGLNHIKVPDWVPGIGGKGINLSHANYKRIPYLAQGAVIPAGNPFLEKGKQLGAAGTSVKKNRK